jgi:hypothetical protein
VFFFLGYFFYWIFFEVFNEKRSDRIAGEGEVYFASVILILNAVYQLKNW